MINTSEYLELFEIFQRTLRITLRQWSILNLNDREKFINLVKIITNIISQYKLNDCKEKTLRIIKIINFDFFILAPELEEKIGFKPKLLFKNE